MSKKGFKPYKTGQRDIYAKYDRKREQKNNQKKDNVKLFGFRSGKSYKMIPALLYYIVCAIYLGYSIYGEFSSLKFEPIDIVLEVLKYIFIFIAFFSPAIFLSDFKYVDGLLLFKKHRLGTDIAGIIIVVAFCYSMMQLNIYCMSDTYKESLRKYDIQWENKKEEQSKSAEENSTTSATDTNESDTVTYDSKSSDTSEKNNHDEGGNNSADDIFSNPKSDSKNDANSNSTSSSSDNSNNKETQKSDTGDDDEWSDLY